jgi:cation diffusion facilitator family transporter
MEISKRYQRSRSRAAQVSLAVSFAMLAIKMGAYLATASATVLSDALESVVHVAATVFMFVCFKLIQAPPDSSHPYGHGKAEHLSVGFEGGMILLAALAIIWQAIQDLVRPGHELSELDIGAWLIGSAAALNLLLGLYLLHVGKSTRSRILAADGKHVLTDVWTSVGVLISLALMVSTRNAHTRLLLDSGCAVVIASIIIITAAKLIRSAVSGLLDGADPKMLAQVVSAINEIRQPDWIDIHNLRLRSSGDITHIDFHMTVPGAWTVAHGHGVEETIERHLLDRLGTRGSVMIHFDYPHQDGSTDVTPPPQAIPSEVTVATATRIKQG